MYYLSSPNTNNRNQGPDDSVLPEPNEERKIVPLNSSKLSPRPSPISNDLDGIYEKVKLVNTDQVLSPPQAAKLGKIKHKAAPSNASGSQSSPRSKSSKTRTKRASNISNSDAPLSPSTPRKLGKGKISSPSDSSPTSPIKLPSASPKRRSSKKLQTNDSDHSGPKRKKPADCRRKSGSLKTPQKQGRNKTTTNQKGLRVSRNPYEQFGKLPTPPLVVASNSVNQVQNENDQESATSSGRNLVNANENASNQAILTDSNHSAWSTHSSDSSRGSWSTVSPPSSEKIIRPAPIKPGVQMVHQTNTQSMSETTSLALVGPVEKAKAFTYTNNTAEKPSTSTGTLSPSKAPITKTTIIKFVGDERHETTTRKDEQGRTVTTIKITKINPPKALQNMTKPNNERQIVSRTIAMGAPPAENASSMASPPVTACPQPITVETRIVPRQSIDQPPVTLAQLGKQYYGSYVDGRPVSFDEANFKIYGEGKSNDPDNKEQSDPDSNNNDQGEEEDFGFGDSTKLNAEDGTSIDGPKEAYGCGKGCMRDRHFKHIFVYLSFFTVLISWMSGAFYDSPGLGWFLFIFIYILFLVEAYYSPTFRYLKGINTTETIVDYLHRLYQTEPKLLMSIACYHYETRVVYYTDSNGYTQSRTETYPVYTHHASEYVRIAAWKDASRPLQLHEVQEYQVTKVKVKKTFAADAGYERQRDNFIILNDRDVFYNFSVDLQIEGYKKHLMTYVDLNKKPEFLSKGWFLLSTWTFFGSLPYRCWISSITGRVKPTVHKLIFTGDKNEAIDLLQSNHKSQATNLDNGNLHSGDSISDDDGLSHDVIGRPPTDERCIRDKEMTTLRRPLNHYTRSTWEEARSKSNYGIPLFDEFVAFHEEGKVLKKDSSSYNFSIPPPNGVLLVSGGGTSNVNGWYKRTDPMEREVWRTGSLVWVVEFIKIHPSLGTTYAERHKSITIARAISPHDTAWYFMTSWMSLLYTNDVNKYNSPDPSSKDIPETKWLRLSGDFGLMPPPECKLLEDDEGDGYSVSCDVKDMYRDINSKSNQDQLDILMEMQRKLYMDFVHKDNIFAPFRKPNASMDRAWYEKMREKLVIPDYDSMLAFAEREIQYKKYPLRVQSSSPPPGGALLLQDGGTRHVNGWYRKANKADTVQSSGTNVVLYVKIDPETGSELPKGEQISIVRVISDEADEEMFGDSSTGSFEKSLLYYMFDAWGRNLYSNTEKKSGPNVDVNKIPLTGWRRYTYNYGCQPAPTFEVPYEDW